MEERHGVLGSLQGDIFFTESVIPDARVLGPVRVEISRQNADLNAVKKQLATKVRMAGGNALMNFRYGQRKHEWWQYLLLKWDTESWYGEGDAVVAK